jgi:Phage tail lysozyme/Putative peptidoglycan binding domain
VAQGDVVAAMLQHGDRGEEVKRLQRILKEHGFFEGTIGGNFLDLTKAAVERFQAAHKGPHGQPLDVDGIVGPDTWWALEQLAAPADVGGSSATDWPARPLAERFAHVMTRLVSAGYPVNAAAGIAGNLHAESGVIPNRLEGSRSGTPTTAPAFGGGTRAFTAEEVMRRDQKAGRGPRLPGVGLAQWTAPGRRAGLFQFRGIGAAILFDMDAQLDYLLAELEHHPVRPVLTDPQVSVEAAADEVVYRFEIPGAVLTPDLKRHRPRTDPQVQKVFEERRRWAREALAAHHGS